MIAISKKSRPAWTAEAETLLKKAPVFVVGFARKAAEREAVKRGARVVTAELLRELAGRHSPHSSDGHARKTSNPLYGSFDEALLTNNHGSKLTAGLPEEEFAAAWRDAAQRRTDTETALYLHTPFCATRCKYCGFFVNGSNPAALRDYADSLVRELEMLCRTEGIGDRAVSCVYFGGGTPSDLDAVSLERILREVRRFRLTEDCEITLEGRVSSFSAKKVAVCQEYGVNRYSLGVQSFHTKLRQSMGRISTREEVIETLRSLHQSTGAAVVVDLIYGLPGQTMELWEEDLRTLGEFPVSGADHYPLIRLPGTSLDREVAAGKMPLPPSAAERADMFVRALELMKSLGGERLSLKHFGFDGREQNRYNRLQAFGGDCIPAGCGAGGAFGGYSFYQGGSIGQYRAALDRREKPLTLVSQVTPEAALLNRLAGELLGNLEFSPATLQQTAGWTQFELAACFEPLLAQYESCGLLTRLDGVAALTRAGQFWHNAIIQNLGNLFRQACHQRSKA